MEKMICIPVWRYELMLKTFDEALKELEELKKPLRKLALLQRQSNPETLE